MLKGLKNFKWGYVIIFLILSCIGALCIAFPDTLKIVCIVSGIILSLYAAILFTLTLARRDRTTAFAFKIVISGIALAAGLVTAILNQQSVGVLTSLLGLYMVIDGSFKLQTTILSKRYRVAAWWIMLSLAIIVIGGGFVSLKLVPTEENAAWSSGILGATLIVDGIANLLTAFFTKAYEKNMASEVLAAAAAEADSPALPDVKDTEAPVSAPAEITEGTEDVKSLEAAEITDEPMVITLDGEELVCTEEK